MAELDIDGHKVVGRFAPDGSVRTDTYFDGQDRADGPGHGHVVTDNEGRVRYLRDAERNQPGSERAERVSVDDRAHRRAQLRARDDRSRDEGRVR